MTFHLELNSDGIVEMLKSPTVAAFCKTMADRIAANASVLMENPEGMLVVDASDEVRARYIVVTANNEAKRAEALDRRLTRAIDAARQ